MALKPNCRVLIFGCFKLGSRCIRDGLLFFGSLVRDLGLGSKRFERFEKGRDEGLQFRVFQW